MKKIKITEKQAELLGLTKKNINENEESGIKSVGVALGDVIVRMVISGESVPKFKDRIIQLISRHDKDARVGFFEATGKIVGNVKEIKLDSIKRDMKALDPNIIVEKKPIAKSLKENVKHIYKITKEQYNRLFASGLIKENDGVKGGLTRVDKEVKKSLPVSSDVMNLTNEDAEGSNFDIKKPNTSLPKSANGTFGKPMTEEDSKTEVSEDPLENETKELIKYLYRKSDTLSPFWEQNGVSYDDLCSHLEAKNFIVSKNGKYHLSKSLGNNPQEALLKFTNELRTLIKPQEVAEPTRPEQSPSPKPASTPVVKDVEVDENNYPAGADNSSAPWNQNDSNASNPKVASKTKLEPIAFNREIVLFKGPDGLYVFYYDNIDKKEFMEYASVPRHYVGKDEDGQAEYDYDFDAAEIDGEVIGHYVNDRLDTLTKGEGLEAYEQGVDLVKIDEALKQELASLYDKDKNIAKVLGPIEEADFDGAMNSFKSNLAQAATPTDKPKIPQSKIVAKLAELKAKEEARRNAEQAAIDAQSGDVTEITGAASSGAFSAPMSTDVVKKDIMDTPIVGETTVAGAGNFQYDTPGGLTMDLGKSNPKTKAEKTTQWAGGSFVKQPDCSKLNNNKSAQGGGCNSGASSLKTVKTGGSINAPSLGENEIYEAIAKKTGKTIDEVKRIIQSKK